jgi:hypothetical protein
MGDYSDMTNDDTSDPMTEPARPTQTVNFPVAPSTMPEMADKSDIVYLGRDPSIMPMDEALEKVFDLYGMPRMGGASGKGWSRIATIQRCLYLYKRRYRDGERGGPSKALEVGSCFHTMMALHYWAMREPQQARITPERLRDELFKLNADAKAIEESWRLYDAYANYYEHDYLVPLGEELFATDGDNSCRYDLIARVEANNQIAPGTYIVEHKTSSRFDAATLEGWKNDGEVIGQIMLYKPAKLTKKYGKLQGVIVNIVGKQKIPKFERVIVPVQAWQMRAHKKDLAFWNAVEQMCVATNNWPRSRAHCTNKYGLCSYFDHCAEKI